MPPIAPAVCRRSSQSDRFGQNAGADGVEAIVSSISPGAPVAHLVDKRSLPDGRVGFERTSCDDRIEGIKDALVLVFVRDMLDDVAAQTHRVDLSLQYGWQEAAETVGFDRHGWQPRARP